MTLNLGNLITLVALLDPLLIQIRSAGDTSEPQQSCWLINARPKTAVNSIRENITRRLEMADADTSYWRLFEARVFVDKSMFIKHILDSEYAVNLITMPRKWGKTINLGMLRLFFNPTTHIPDYKIRPLKRAANLDLFRYSKICIDEECRHLENPLLISEHEEIIDQHMGQHPVVYLDLFGIWPLDYNGAMYSVIEAIYEAFEKHKYLTSMMYGKKYDCSLEQRRVVKDDIRMFKNFANGRYGRHFENHSLYVESISFLCRVLNKYSNFKKPVVLIDDYDHGLNNAFIAAKWPNKNKTQFFDFFRDFFAATFKNDENFHLEVITGSLCINERELFKGVRNFKHTNFLSGDPVFSFFAFTENELKDIFKMGGVTVERYEKVRKQYSAYNGGSDFSLRLYNPWAIANNLYCEWSQCKDVGTVTGRLDGLLKEFMRCEIFRKHITNVLEGGMLEIRQPLDVTKEELFDLRDFRHDPSTECETMSHANLMNTLLKLMATAGYFTTERVVCNKNYTITARIAHEVMKMDLRIWKGLF